MASSRIRVFPDLLMTLLAAASALPQGGLVHAQPALADVTITIKGVRLQVFSAQAGTVAGRLYWREQWGTERPVCDIAIPDDAAAQVMCGVLNYPYGRKYWEPSVTFRPEPDCNTRRSERPWANLVCSPVQHRRALRGRSLNSLALYTLAEGPYDIDGVSSSCQFTIGDCDYMGALAGLECSNAPFQTPPTTQLVAPPPPSVETWLRVLVSDSWAAIWSSISSGPLEPNLCRAGDTTCLSMARAEVLVNTARGPAFAPLCAPPPSTAYATVSALQSVLCRQAYGWRVTSFFEPMAMSGLPTSFALPKGAPKGASDFKPKRIAFWASYDSGNITSCTRSVQELKLTVSTKACRYGLLAFRCAILAY